MGKGRHREVERLSVADVANLYADRAGMPMQVALLARLSGPPVGGEALVAEVAAAVGSRLAHAPRLRQRVVWPRWGRGRPYWLDDAGFAIGDHVRHVELDPPGDEAALLDQCAGLGAAVLDRSRPLWEFTVVTGLDGGGAAIYFKLHHAVADGFAALATMAALLDPPGEGLPVVTAPVAWEPRRPPSGWALAADNARRRAGDVGHALACLLHPVESVRRFAAAIRAAVADLAGMRKAPRCSINTRLGSRRSLALVHVPLADVKAAGHAAGGSVNDVVLAVVAAGLRALFAHRGERIGAPLVVSVPMSTRAADDTESGNRVSVVPVPVPVDEADVAVCLREVVRTTRERKQIGRVSGYSVLSSELLPLRLQRRIMDAMATGDQRMVNVFATNVPGPPEPMRLASRGLVDAYPVAPIAGNVTVGVAVLSYAGELYFTVHADPDANPDVDVMAAGMRDALDTLCGPQG